MKKNCDNCGFYNAMMEGCGNPKECTPKKNGDLSGWIPVSRRRVLAGRIVELPRK